MAYYTLIVMMPGSNHWIPEFGDKERPVVAQEKTDTKESWPKGTQFKIVKTKTSRQSDIDKVIAIENAAAVTARQFAGAFRK